MKYRYSLSYSDGRRRHHHEAAFSAKNDQDAVDTLNEILRNKFHYCYELIDLADVRLMRIEKIEYPLKENDDG